MTLYEIAEKFNISLTKLRRMQKAGVLHCDSGEGYPQAPTMRLYLTDNRPLSVSQLMTLIENPAVYAELRTKQGAAKLQVAALGDYAADAPPVSLLRVIRDAAENDDVALEAFTLWLLKTLPSHGVPYAWIAVRAIQIVKNKAAQEEILLKFAKALHYARKDPNFAQYVTERKVGARTFKIYAGYRTNLLDL